MGGIRAWNGVGRIRNKAGHERHAETQTLGDMARAEFRGLGFIPARLASIANATKASDAAYFQAFDQQRALVLRKRVQWYCILAIALLSLAPIVDFFTLLTTGSLSRQQSGTGLGLILVQRMADLHGGSVHVESSVGQGSRFAVALPWIRFEEPHDGYLLNESREDDLQAAKHCHDFRVLLVDDNANNIAVYSDYLQVKGYTVVSAGSGLQGVLLAHEEHPDLILMDIQMPGLDGVEAIQRIRSSSDAQVAAVPVIALTALAMPGDKERCLQAGANDYLSKPVSLQTLIRTVETYCFSAK